MSLYLILDALSFLLYFTLVLNGKLVVFSSLFSEALSWHSSQTMCGPWFHMECGLCVHCHISVLISLHDTCMSLIWCYTSTMFYFNFLTFHVFPLPLVSVNVDNSIFSFTRSLLSEYSKTTFNESCVLFVSKLLAALVIHGLIFSSTAVMPMRIVSNSPWISSLEQDENPRDGIGIQEKPCVCWWVIAHTHAYMLSISLDFSWIWVQSFLTWIQK